MALPCLQMGVEPKIMVPQNGWFIRENPMNKWMIWGVCPYFWKHPNGLQLQVETQRHEGLEDDLPFSIPVIFRFHVNFPGAFMVFLEVC